MYMTSEERAEAREHADDDGKYGFCSSCEFDVRIGIVDEGFDHEFGFHSLPTSVCSECGERM